MERAFEKKGTIMDEQYYEKLLNITTGGEQKRFNESPHYNRYEPTSYSVLEILTKQYTFTADDHVVDFGCGKGRLNFYINYFFDSTVTGVEMNPFFYKQAVHNQQEYLQKQKKKTNKIHFINTLAEDYPISPNDNKFYFFNPFSLQIFTKVINTILLSTKDQQRTVDIILYYPSYDFLCFLENYTPFTLFNTINFPDDRDPRQSFSIYRLERTIRT